MTVVYDDVADYGHPPIFLTSSLQQKVELIKQNWQLLLKTGGAGLSLHSLALAWLNITLEHSFVCLTKKKIVLVVYWLWRCIFID